MRGYCTSVFLFVWIGAAAAAPLQLENVLDGVIRNSPALAHADNKVALSQGKLHEAQGVFDWRVTGQAGWARLYYPGTAIVGGTRVLTDQLESSSALRVQAGVGRLFRNGLSVEPGISYYSQTSASRAQTFGLTRPTPSINLTVPLLHALDGHNTAAAAEQAAILDLGGSRLDHDFALQQAVTDGAQTYWRCLAARQENGLLQAAQKTSQDNIASLQARAKAGQIDQATLERAVAAQIRKDGELDKTQQAELLCRADLAVLLKSQAPQELPTIAQAVPELERAAQEVSGADVKALTESAYERRPDILALQAYVRAAEERVIGARGETDPKVNLTADINGAFVSVSKSLGTSAEDGRLEQAEAARRDAELNLAQFKDRIGRDIQGTVLGLQSASRQLRQLRHSAAVLEAVAAQMQHKAQAGAADWEEYRAAQAELTDIRLQTVDAELNCVLTIATFQLVTGGIDTRAQESLPVMAGLFRAPGPMR